MRDFLGNYTCLRYNARMVMPETLPEEAAAAEAARLRSRRIAAWVLVVAWAAFIFFMSAHTGSDLDDGNGLAAVVKRWLTDAIAAATGQRVDVSPVGHFCEYFVFGALLVNAFRLHVPLKRAVTCSVVISALYAVSDEVHQIFVPGRACDPADWAVDVVAAILAALITAAILRVIQRKGDKHDDEAGGVERDEA